MHMKFELWKQEIVVDILNGFSAKFVEGLISGNPKNLEIKIEKFRRNIKYVNWGFSA